MNAKTYYVYILECSDGTLYTGYTDDISKRVAAHNAGKVGAKYTKGRTPVTLRYHESCISRSDALKREYFLKQLTRAQKLALISA